MAGVGVVGVGVGAGGNRGTQQALYGVAFCLSLSLSLSLLPSGLFCLRSYRSKYNASIINDLLFSYTAIIYISNLTKHTLLVDVLGSGIFSSFQSICQRSVFC